MKPLHFDLNDIDQEPSDEQLASLMEAVLEEVRHKATTAHAQWWAELKAQIAAAPVREALNNPQGSNHKAETGQGLFQTTHCFTKKGSGFASPFFDQTFDEEPPQGGCSAFP